MQHGRTHKNNTRSQTRQKDLAAMRDIPAHSPPPPPANTCYATATSLRLLCKYTQPWTNLLESPAHDLKCASAVVCESLSLSVCVCARASVCVCVCVCPCVCTCMHASSCLQYPRQKSKSSLQKRKICKPII